MRTLQAFRSLKTYCDVKTADQKELNEIANDVEFLMKNYKPTEVRGFLNDLDYRANVIEMLIPRKRVGRLPKAEKTQLYNLRYLVRDIPFELDLIPEEIPTFNAAVEKYLKDHRPQDIKLLFETDICDSDSSCSTTASSVIESSE